MNIILCTATACENWSYDNPDKQGIGGSETSQIELAWRFAERGHKVFSYAPVPWEGVREWRGTEWSTIDHIDYSKPGLWIVYRSPELLDFFSKDHPDQIVWLMAQDTYYAAASVERYAKIDKYICLCRDHATATAGHWPSLKDKILLSRNGIRSEKILEVLGEGIPRNPKKIVYCSSPDRGLKNAAVIFSKAREYVPDLELHYYYGWNNVESMTDGKDDAGSRYWRKIMKDIAQYTDRPGIVNHRRIPQPELWREIASAGIWLYPTSFQETGCIANMECQALGAIPITNPIWALRDYCAGGIHIQGNPDTDLLVRSRYVGEIIRLISDPDFSDSIRYPMMKQAVEEFSWAGVADQLIAEAEDGMLGRILDQSAVAVGV